MTRRFVAFVLASLLAAPCIAALETGALAPLFKAPAYLAGKPFTFDLGAALKRGPVVVYFFPAAFTSGCNVEAAAFSQAIDKFKAHGATVIGVTSGNTERLAEFSSDTEKCAGKFPVAADAGATIARSYDATMSMKPDLSSRTSFVIGRNGRIVHVHDAMNPNQHVKETLDAVAALARPTPAKAKAKAKGG